MGSHIEPARLLLSEPVPIIPVYCDALGLVDLVGGRMHFVLYVQQPSIIDSGDIERIVNLRVVMPPEGVAAALPIVARKLASMTVDRVSETALRMFM